MFIKRGKDRENFLIAVRMGVVLFGSSSFCCFCVGWQSGAGRGFFLVVHCLGVSGRCPAGCQGKSSRPDTEASCLPRLSGPYRFRGVLVPSDGGVRFVLFHTCIDKYAYGNDSQS